MRNIVVTGANGFIGSSLIKQLLNTGTHVVALDVSFANSRLPKSPKVTMIETCLDDVEKLFDQIPAGTYDAFYHFAWAGVNGPSKADPVTQLKNIEITINCAIVAKKIGCKKMLCAGTVAEQSVKSLSALETTSGGMMYGVAKHCAHMILETYCKNIGLNFVWMQFSNIYGPANKTGNLVSYTIGALKKDTPAIFGPAMQPYDFIFVEDLIEAVKRLGETPAVRSFYFIGSGAPRLLKDYLTEIGSIYGREDLIHIGERPDDGVQYTFDMFDASTLKEDIGEYITKDFTSGIKFTIENY